MVLGMFDTWVGGPIGAEGRRCSNVLDFETSVRKRSIG